MVYTQEPVKEQLVILLTYPQVMLSIAKEQPDLLVSMREKDLLQGDDIRML